jgi:CHAT domain-containing protein
VDEPRPVSGNALPNSAAEVAAIASLFKAPRVLRHEQATRTAVLAALSQAQVVHLSCHGATDWAEPLRSGVVLAGDEMLTVGDLLDRRLPAARLATLSACETGIVGTKLPDEVVALPTALAQAGFAGVAASLWSVADVSTAMLMERFYRLWRTDGLAPALALCEAQRWLRDTTNREKADYFRRDIPTFSPDKMPEMIAADFFSQATMRRPDGRDFAHPFWWAAFYLTGV